MDSNEHLAPVFEVMLPTLDENGVCYWVYGGVGVAGTVGEFFDETVTSTSMCAARMHSIARVRCCLYCVNLDAPGAS